MTVLGDARDTCSTIIAVLSMEVDADSASREDVLRYLYQRLGLELKITELTKVKPA